VLSPSGLLPSARESVDGSSLAGTSADAKARLMRSLMALCLAWRPANWRQLRPCVPDESTPPHRHTYVVRTRGRQDVVWRQCAKSCRLASCQPTNRARLGEMLYFRGIEASGLLPVSTLSCLVLICHFSPKQQVVTLPSLSVIYLNLRDKHAALITSWFGRLSHDTPAVKGDAHCWIFAEEPKNCDPMLLKFYLGIWFVACIRVRWLCWPCARMVNNHRKQIFTMCTRTARLSHSVRYCHSPCADLSVKKMRKM